MKKYISIVLGLIFGVISYFCFSNTFTTCMCGHTTFWNWEHFQTTNGLDMPMGEPIEKTKEEIEKEKIEEYNQAKKDYFITIEKYEEMKKEYKIYWPLWK